MRRAGANRHEPVPFYRLSGGGNDFLALAEPAAPPPPERVRAWCRRGVSLGADGLFFLRRSPDGVTMEHFNADGTAVDLCLNGSRCAARLAFALGWASGEVAVTTNAGRLLGHDVDDSTIRLEAPLPEHPAERMAACDLATDLPAWRLCVGVPHAVLVSEDPIESLALDRLAPPIRHHPALGSGGANVDVVRFGTPGQAEVRTWERGVEGETLACGTGALAVAAVGLQLERCRLPLVVSTRGGFRLQVEGRVEAGHPRSWSLAGDARLLARGELFAAAEAQPASAKLPGP